MSDTGAQAPPGFERRGEEEVYAGHVFKVVRAHFADPEGQPFERDVVRHPGAVAVVAVDAEGTATWSASTAPPVDRELLEIPAGTCDVDGRAARATARRELAEEAGLEAEPDGAAGHRVQLPGLLRPAHDHLYLATGLRPVPPAAPGGEERWMTVGGWPSADVEPWWPTGDWSTQTTCWPCCWPAGAGPSGPDGPVPRRRRCRPADAEEYLSWLAVERGRARNTVASYRRDLRRLRGDPGRRGRTPVDDAGPGDVAAHLERLRAGGAQPRHGGPVPSAACGAAPVPPRRGGATSRPDRRGRRRPPCPAASPRRSPRTRWTGCSAPPPATTPVDPARPGPARGPLRHRGRDLRGGRAATWRTSAPATGSLRLYGKGSKERLVPLGRCAVEALDRWLGPRGAGRHGPQAVAAGAATPRRCS